MDELVSETEYFNLDLAGGDFSGQCASLVSISKGRLARVGLSRTHLHKLDLDRVVFDACDMANAAWEMARLDKVTLNDCRLIGLGLSRSSIKECVFQACEASLADFRAITCKKSRFIRCKLQGADFQHADLRHVVFENCDLRGAQMFSAKLEGADLRGSEIENLQIGIEHLRGAIVDPAQAAYLAGYMGLKVMF